MSKDFVFWHFKIQMNKCVKLKFVCLFRGQGKLTNIVDTSTTLKISSYKGHQLEAIGNVSIDKASKIGFSPC
jgi:hypothetical protein